MGTGGSDRSSSGEEDGDAQWRQAIASVVTNVGVSLANGSSSSKSNNSTKPVQDTYSQNQNEPQALKLYQIKAQKLLEDYLERHLEIVKSPNPTLDNGQQADEPGIRLFRQAPPGMTLKPIDEFQQPRKRPRIVPREEADEKSKKFRRRLQSVVVDGTDVITVARNSNKKALARFEAKIAAKKVAAQREEERVAKLKKIRGEKWLPSIAREMQVPNMVLAHLLQLLDHNREASRRVNLFANLFTRAYAVPA